MPTADIDASAMTPALPTLAVMERQIIEGRLRMFGGCKATAAASLGISLKTLYNRLNAWKAADEAASALETGA